MEEYKKAPLTYSEQLELLKSRGLTINNPAEALLFLTQVNYYRLAGYGFLFQKPHDVFIPGTTFEQIVALYKLDEELRDVVFAMLTPIEIFLRTRMAYELSHKWGTFAHYDISIYQYEEKGKQWLTELEQDTIDSGEPFLHHYKDKYKDFPKLPLWIACEIMNLNSLSKFFSRLSPEAKRLICTFAEVDHGVFATWLHTITYMRNICAHHNRPWNRELSIKPFIPRKDKRWQGLGLDPTRLFTSLALAEWVCNKAELPMCNVEPVYETMRKIASLDTRFARMMGVPLGRAIGMCWETK